MSARAPTLTLLTAALLLLLCGGATSQADTTPVVITVGKKAVFTIDAPPGCKVSVTVTTDGDHAFDPEVIKPQAKKGNKGQQVLTCKGLQPGVSTFRYDYTTTGPCNGAGGFLYEITVVNDPNAAAKAWAKRLKELLKELKGSLKGLSASSLKDMGAATKKVKKGEVEDLDDFLRTRFEKVQCDREAMLAAALAALEIASDEGTDTLRGLDIPDRDKGPDFSTGGCGEWDKYAKACNDALRQADGKIIGADMKFTKAFNAAGAFGRLTSVLNPLPSLDIEPPLGEGVDGLADEEVFRARFGEAIAALQAHAHPLPTLDPGVEPEATVRVCILRPESVEADPGGIPPLDLSLIPALGAPVPVPLGGQVGHKQIGELGFEQIGFLALLREAAEVVGLDSAHCSFGGPDPSDEILDTIGLL